MRVPVCLLIAVCLLGSVAFAGPTTWNTPQNNQSVGVPTLFDCTSSGTTVYMKLWVDGVAQYTVHQSRMTVVLNLAAGSHTVDCQSNDGINPSYNNDITVNVTSNLHDYADLDDSSWTQCPTCNSGTAPNASTELVTSPQEDGQSREFDIAYVSGPSAFEDMYWYMKRCNAPIGQLAGELVYQFGVYVTPNDSPHALEWGVTQWFSGYRYRLAVQANYSAGLWKIYDPGKGTWVSSNVSFTGFSTGQWHSVIVVGKPDGSGHMVQVQAIQVDGIGSAVTTPASVSATAETSSCSEWNSNSYQSDLDNGVDGAFTVYLDKVIFNIQP
jgi:hypothetical protein